MALKHQFTLFCHYVTKSETGTASYIDAFTNINFPRLPARFHFFVVVGFQGTTGDIFSITFDGPDGKVIETLLDGVVGEDAGTVDFAKRGWVEVGVFHQAMTHHLFEAGGIYFVSLRHGKKVVHRSPLGVSIKEDPAPRRPARPMIPVSERLA